MNYLDIFLKSYGLTRYKFSKLSGITQARLSQMNAENFKTTTVKTIYELSSATKLKPWEVLQQLINIINSPIFRFIENNDLDQDLVSNIEKYLINYMKGHRKPPEIEINSVDDLKELIN